MRPGVLKRALVVVGCGALAVTASACESTESESAKIGRQAGAAEVASSLKLGKIDRGVRVSDVTPLSGGGRKAIAVKLTQSSSRTQREVPLLVRELDAGGKVVYSNATGAETLLQRVTLLPGPKEHLVGRRRGADQSVRVVGEVTVGTGQRVASNTRAGALSATPTGITGQAGSNSVGAELTNDTGKAQSNAPVFAVALRGSKIVAAGRAVVATLPAHGAPATLNIPLVGNATGAKIELTALPGPSASTGGGLK